ncbi:4Fe-4S binding protein [bacterium]|nr:4Fe-4S binding protein [bacterium]
MTFVITEKCLGERYASCMQVCPVYCIYPAEYKGEIFAVIDPELCIDCGACVPECPVEAIVDDPDIAPEWTKINEELAPKFKDSPMPEVRPATDPPRKGNVYNDPRKK